MREEGVSACSKQVLPLYTGDDVGPHTVGSQQAARVGAAACLHSGTAVHGSQNKGPMRRRLLAERPGCCCALRAAGLGAADAARRRQIAPAPDRSCLPPPPLLSLHDDTRGNVFKVGAASKFSSPARSRTRTSRAPPPAPRPPTHRRVAVAASPHSRTGECRRPASRSCTSCSRLRSCGTSDAPAGCAVALVLHSTLNSQGRAARRSARRPARLMRGERASIDRPVACRCLVSARPPLAASLPSLSRHTSRPRIL
jgi:hypothetical protein